mmetsp:Transcript_12850/g.34503  ORF Transcript_12850/g.34503 Transcript_12850/m.34503 type:complete len:209 (-) Transcript_12850:627-1253(-)
MSRLETERASNGKRTRVNLAGCRSAGFHQRLVSAALPRRGGARTRRRRRSPTETAFGCRCRHWRRLESSALPRPHCAAAAGSRPRPSGPPRRPLRRAPCRGRSGQRVCAMGHPPRGASISAGPKSPLFGRGAQAGPQLRRRPARTAGPRKCLRARAGGRRRRHVRRSSALDPTSPQGRCGVHRQVRRSYAAPGCLATAPRPKKAVGQA